MVNAQSSLKIVQVEGIATSFPVQQGVTLGIGRAVKRDAILVKVTTECGLVGWGESHHGRAPGAIAQLMSRVGAAEYAGIGVKVAEQRARLFDQCQPFEVGGVLGVE